MSTWDDDAGYDTDDPKHPDWSDRAADAADLARKREKEQPLIDAAIEADAQKDIEVTVNYRFGDDGKPLDVYTGEPLDL